MAKIKAVKKRDQINLVSCPECGSMDVYWFTPTLDSNEKERTFDLLCTCEQCDADWHVTVNVNKE